MDSPLLSMAMTPLGTSSLNSGLRHRSSLKYTLVIIVKSEQNVEFNRFSTPFPTTKREHAVGGPSVVDARVEFHRRICTGGLFAPPPVFSRRTTTHCHHHR